MRINSVLAGLIVAASLSACGGGGDAAPSSATQQAVKKESLMGDFGVVTGSIMPDPATESDSIVVTINTSYKGMMPKTPDDFTVPVIIRKIGTTETVTGSVKFTLRSSTASIGEFDGLAVMTLPALKAGTYQYGIKLDPQSKYDLQGDVATEAFGTVTVTANTPR